jgi:hypothetical protein
MTDLLKLILGILASRFKGESNAGHWAISQGRPREHEGISNHRRSPPVLMPAAIGCG